MNATSRSRVPSQSASRTGHVLMKSAPESIFSGQARIKSVQAKKAKLALRKRCKIPAPLRAIREFCLQCMGGTTNYVKECSLAKICPLWPYRMGRSPHAEDMQCAQYNRRGHVSHWIEFEECPERGKQ